MRLNWHDGLSGELKEPIRILKLKELILWRLYRNTADTSINTEGCPPDCCNSHLVLPVILLFPFGVWNMKWSLQTYIYWMTDGNSSRWHEICIWSILLFPQVYFNYTVRKGKNKNYKWKIEDCISIHISTQPNLTISVRLFKKTCCIRSDVTEEYPINYMTEENICITLLSLLDLQTWNKTLQLVHS